MIWVGRDREDRRAAIGADGAQDRLAAAHHATFDLDVIDGEAEPRCLVDHVSLEMRGERRGRAGVDEIGAAAGAAEQEQTETEHDDVAAVAREAPPRTTCRRLLGGALARRLRVVAVASDQASHAAFSTIQATSSLKLDAGMTRDVGDQRGRGHAGLRIDLEQIEAAGLACDVVVAQIGAADAAAAERPMGAERDVERLVIGSGWIGAGIRCSEPPSAYFAV